MTERRPPLPPARPIRPRAGVELLFLRDEDMRQAQMLMTQACRGFAGLLDPLLEEMQIGHAHQRILQFVKNEPDISVGALLDILSITKQSMARALNDLVRRGLLHQRASTRDRRMRLLRLTDAGYEMERRLFERQRDILLRVYRDAGGPAVEGFRKVMRGLIEESQNMARHHDDKAPAQTQRSRE
ncbi:MarR family transcriptional regulator [Novacetimonas hansenii]|uniref:MarR family transcriptional regulator n=1 Tax=Novacetimonas hansenii TaxID=436 RepID=UPI0030B914B2